MGTSFAGCCKRAETRDACVGTGDKDIYGGRIVSVRSPKYGARRYERYTATEGEEVHSVVSQPVSTESFMDLRSNSSHGMDHSSLERINSFATIIRTRDVRTTKKLEEVEIERRAEMMHAENTLFGSMKLMIDLVPHCPNSEATSKLLLTLSSAHLADSSENFYDCMSPRLMDYRSPRLAGTRSMRLNRMNSAVSSPRSRLESTSSGMLLKQIQIDFDYKKTKNVDCVTTEDWDVTWNIPEATEILSRGDAIMNFCCRPASDLSERERALANLVINVNSIYSVEDGYPSTDLYLEDDVERYTMIITRATYLLPDLNLVELTPQLIASPGYQKGCLPGNPYLWPQQGTSDEDMRTFRLTKSLVPFVYSMVIQMRVSEITDPDVLQRLREIDNIPITRVLLLERTRRNKNATDSTAKVRSLLMYYRLPDGKGVLMTNFTVVCNNFIPKIVAAVVQSFGSKGASEIAETVKRTRKYFTAPENKHLVL